VVVARVRSSGSRKTGGSKRGEQFDSMNLEAVAKRAKVSTATVSRVLNNTGPVKASTKARVLKVVEELKYHPNLHARSLAGGKSRTIGIIVSNMENPFFFDIFKAAETQALAHGIEILAANTNYSPEQLVSSIRLMIGRRVAGLAIIVSEMEPHLIEELSESRMPVVFYDVGTPKQNISNVRVDYARGVEKAVDYLYDLGHRRMAFVSHHSALGPISIREKAFRKAVSRHASQVEWTIAANLDSLEGGREAGLEILNSGFKPSAIVCVNDFTALGVLSSLREQGLRVPQDVSVTGFDNIKLSEFCWPSLTTLHIPRETIGHIVFEALAPDIVKTRPVGREVVIHPEFVLRDSTGPVRKPA
jgi:LacI family transcriptional regulator